MNHLQKKQRHHHCKLNNDGLGRREFLRVTGAGSLGLLAEKNYADYLGAVKYGNIFSLEVGPDYHGRLRAIDAATLRQVGDMIRTNAPTPVLPVSDATK